MTNPDLLDPFIAHVVHSLPHNEHNSNLSWDAIVSQKGKFFSFTVRIDRDNSARFFDISNLLRENCKLTMTDTQLLNILREYDQRGLCKITAGGASMEAFASGEWKWYYDKFPQLEPDTKKSLHDAYIGGFMAAKEGAYGKAIDVDCNSMYPSILRDEWLPWGLPEPYEGKYVQDDDMPLHCDELTFRAELKPDGYPLLLDDRSAYGLNRLTSTRGYITRVLTDIDQKLLHENYEVSVYRHVRGWKFRRSKGFFRSFIDEWGELKQNAAGEKRQMAKLVMNALVGKMASLPKGAVMLPRSKDGITLDWDIATTRRIEFENRFSSRTRMGQRLCKAKAYGRVPRERRPAFVRQYGRCILSGWEPVRSCEIHPTELGKWKIAAKYEKLTILGMNRYQGWKDDGDVDICMAGSQFSHPIPYKDFRHGVQVMDDYGTLVML